MDSNQTPKKFHSLLALSASGIIFPVTLNSEAPTGTGSCWRVWCVFMLFDVFPFFLDLP